MIKVAKEKNHAGHTPKREMVVFYSQYADMCQVCANEAVGGK